MSKALPVHQNLDLCGRVDVPEAIGEELFVGPAVEGVDHAAIVMCLYPGVASVVAVFEEVGHMDGIGLNADRDAFRVARITLVLPMVKGGHSPAVVAFRHSGDCDGRDARLCVCRGDFLQQQFPLEGSDVAHVVRFVDPVASQVLFLVRVPDEDQGLALVGAKCCGEMEAEKADKKG